MSCRRYCTLFTDNGGNRENGGDRENYATNKEAALRAAFRIPAGTNV